MIAKNARKYLENRFFEGVATNPAELVANAENLFISVHNSNQTLDAIGDQVRLEAFILSRKVQHWMGQKLTETALSTCLATIQRQVEETSSVNEQKLKYLESIQAKELNLEAKKAELVKELKHLEVKMQGADVEIHKANNEMSHNPHLMAHLLAKETNLRSTPTIPSKDFEDQETLCVLLEEEQAEVAQLKWMN
ncbi:hypothetical protein ACH5RR_040810 [Cinchona calisaya]|uniref:Uncharacterized protein n=1 Tax=Cinchona calisaya TaxID=153742 RepID=A0ABD2XX59_9GENT